MKNFTRSVAAASIFFASASAQASGHPSWYVVVGSTTQRTPPTAGLAHGIEIKSLAASCGFRSWTTDSDAFDGLRPGRYVHVVGPYGSPAAALSVLRRVRPCIQDARIIRSGYDSGYGDSREDE